jgi:DNA polymerase V
MVGLVDCNNFFASCERVFNPKMIGKPVVVLSSNDGCVIARSEEAKKAGIPMGIPAFKAQPLFAKNKVQVFSANFSLYGSLSKKIMRNLKNFSPKVEIYSIDEAFLNLDHAAANLTAFALDMRGKVMKATGVPISIGIAETKTLAKLASHRAKQHGGVFEWCSLQNEDEELKKIPVEEVWGVGWKSGPKLNSLGIYSVFQLKNANQSWMKQTFGINMLRTITELNKTPCIYLHTNEDFRKGIMSSQMFGENIESFEKLSEAVSSYTSRACLKLRNQKSVASHIYVFIKSKYVKNQNQYYSSQVTALPGLSSNTGDFIKAALQALEGIYKPGYLYKKAGVMLTGIVPESQAQISLSHSERLKQKSDKIMHGIDEINSRYGRDFIRYASSGIKREWQAKKRMSSPKYTTSWNELLTIR